MGQTLAGKDQWFVVHVLSGQESKVRENILKRVKTEEMADLIYDVLVPTERVSEIKKGKKSETTRKFFPGYLIVNMHLLDENNQLVGRTWYFIRDTPGVIGFAGTKDKPIPMRQSEVDSMLAQMKEREAPESAADRRSACRSRCRRATENRRCPRDRQPRKQDRQCDRQRRSWSSTGTRFSGPVRQRTRHRMQTGRVAYRPVPLAQALPRTR